MTNTDILDALNDSLENLKRAVFFLKIAKQIAPSPMNTSIELFIRDLEDVLKGKPDEEGLIQYIKRQK
jgi:hypothetical protein